MDGKPSRYKARWVAKSYERIYDINFEETYVTIIKATTYRILFALIAHFSWQAVLMHAVTAFLNSGIDVTVYMQLHTRYCGDLSKIAILLKTLYGLKQSARQWASLLGVGLKEAGLKPLYSDFSVYVRSPRTVKMVIVAIYVDDIFITGPDRDEINVLKMWLSNRFRMKDLGLCHHYLGMKVDCDLEAKTLTISQSVYVQKALESMGMQDCKSATTPMAKNRNLVSNPETADPLSVRNYQSAIGTLMYAMTQTLSDLAYSVSTLSKISANPSKEHTGAVKRIYRYLQRTKSLSLIYRGDCELKLVGYTDSDLGGDKETRRST